MVNPYPENPAETDASIESWIGAVNENGEPNLISQTYTEGTLIRLDILGLSRYKKVQTASKIQAFLEMVNGVVEMKETGQPGILSAN